MPAFLLGQDLIYLSVQSLTVFRFPLDFLDVDRLIIHDQYIKNLRKQNVS